MSVKVQINGEWKEIKADAGDEVTYDQVVEAAGLPTDRVYRIEYTGAVGLGGDLISDILREGESVKVRDAITTFTITPSAQT